MRKDFALKKAGITVIRKLSNMEINEIASNISDKICEFFPEHNINKTDLSIELSRVKMYLAQFEDNSAAKYYYKNNSMYFKENIDFENIETPALHECLHFIQAVRNKRGKIIKLGLYDLTTLKPTGLVLNEAAVQLMASHAVSSKVDSVKYYDMEFSTESPYYYPIECALVKQMTYFTGIYPLYHSAIYSDDIFKNTFIMKSNEKTFKTIITNLDLIEQYEEKLHKENSFLSCAEGNNNSTKITNCQKNIEQLKMSIKNLTLKTQELILISCTYSNLNLVRDEQDVNEFKNKLYNFKDFLIITENYTFFNDFYCQMMEELDIKRELIKKYGILNYFKDIKEDFALVKTKQESSNLFKIAIEKIKSLLHLDSKENFLKRNN